MAGQQETKWVQVDLGESLPIDEVVLVPAHVVYGGHPGPGFGFPPNFRVEVCDTPDFAVPHVVLDHTQQAFPHPGDAPVAAVASGIAGRYVRVTATRLWERTNDWIFALAELQVRLGHQQRRPGQDRDGVGFDRSGAELGQGESGRRVQQRCLAPARHQSRRDELTAKLSAAKKSPSRVGGRLARRVDAR